MKKSISFILCIVFLAACSSSRDIGSERVVETGGDKPDWFQIISKVDDDGKIVYIKGQFTGATFKSDGMKAAKYDAINELSQLIGSYISNVGYTSESGSPRSEAGMGHFIKDAISFSNKDPLLIYNSFKPETYYEKREKITSLGKNYDYDCYVLIKMNKTEYDDLVTRVINGGVEAAREKNDLEAKNFGERALENHLKAMENLKSGDVN